MSDPTDTPELNALDAAFDRGDIAEVRRCLHRLSNEEHQALKDEIGSESYAQILAVLRRARRGRRRGKVIVLHGIMGSKLAVKRGRDTDGVWMNFWRLMKGRIADLELDAGGHPVDPDVEVIIKGHMKKYYLPMVVHLDQHWDVIPFSYDWRKDIDDSSDRLAKVVREFAGGEPVHLVAHSMGGLVSRNMIRKFPELWKKMADSDGLKRGGRLIMLGTPNHGSYSIPMALSGTDKMLRMLGKLDIPHSTNEVVGITNSFAGSYQMLPSPHIANGDDHAALFDQQSWASQKVRAPLLKRAKAFHDGLRTVIDPERFVYVAGYNTKTPHRLKIQSPGKFQYQETRDGDGRVPHELGLLEGVDTYWSDAVHGDLARDKDVLAGIDELLLSGATDALPAERPERRDVASKAWRGAAAFSAEDPVAIGMLARETRNVNSRKSRLTEAERNYYEQSMVSDYLGRVDQPASVIEGEEDRQVPTLDVEVVWGDITRCEGDVFAVGHYQGVLPQQAEMALDAQISNDPRFERIDEHVLRQHTLRGMLRGALGDVDFFPWHAPDQPIRTVAVAGMGRIGSFDAESARVLGQKLSWSVSGLKGVETVCTVLIGSGEGSLPIDTALSGMLTGIADAMSDDNIDQLSTVRKLRIVELYRDRAEAIFEELKRQSAGMEGSINLVLPKKVVLGDARRVRPEDALEMLIADMIDESPSALNKRDKKRLDDRLKSAADGRAPISLMRKALEKAHWRGGQSDSSVRYHVRQGEAAATVDVPFRLSYTSDGADIRIAAISDTATVAERILGFDPEIIQSVSAEVTDPDKPLRPVTKTFLRRLAVPQEFEEMLDRGQSFVFEVDRNMAQVPWEILAGKHGDENALPLSIRAQFGRQLRTSYSGAPSMAEQQVRRVRALIIGDPGDPENGDNLPGAQDEAFAVKEVLEAAGIAVDFLVGSETVPRIGRLRTVAAASRSRVMEYLMTNDYQILHYCGHGDFDPRRPDRAGWLFADGMLTAAELERVSRVPNLVCANACLSSRTVAGVERRGQALLPSLADEFFRRGVVNYIGTAWEVSDQGAILFAKTLYSTLLAHEGDQPSARFNTVGAAVQAARAALYQERAIYDKLWAAYQHYGDPTSPFCRLEQADR
ncbi:MAG: CHAT domain-containing protein [Woeseiaceae bacterium]